jgi:hypothetical protein
VGSLMARHLRVVLLMACATMGAVLPSYGQSDVPAYSKIKGEMKVLAAVIDESMAQTFHPPFGVLEKTKGTYLPGFGVVFALEVNLYPIRTLSMFNLKPLTKEEIEKGLKVKRERIGTIKQAVPRLLANHAHELDALASEESVAVIVHLFQVQEEGETLPSQIVMEVKKHELEQCWDKKLTYEQFLKQVRIVEY